MPALRIVALLLLVAVLAACERVGPPAPVVSGLGSARLEAAAPSPPPIALPQPSVSGPHPDQVTVQAGETLYAVSRRYGIPIRSLIDANRLTPPYRLNAGSKLVLPQVGQYVVQPGETLAQVSRRLGVESSTLVQMNHLEAPYGLKIGQVLALPPPAERIAAAPQREVKPLPSVVAETLPEPPRPPEPPKSVEPPQKAAPPVAAPPEVVAKASPEPPTAPPPKSQPVAEPPVVQPPPVIQPPAPPVEPSLPVPVAGRGFLWPVQGRVLASFGPASGGTQNDGINIAAPEGTPVLAADAGEVAYVGNELRGFGNLILIKHAGGWMTAYAHNEKVLVRRFDKVKRGQAIARVGATGAVGEPQLHFELRRGSRALDPTEYLPRLSAAKD